MKNMKLYLICVICWIFCLFASNIQAQIPEFRILPDDSIRDQEFGHSVSIFGNYAVVGTILDGDRGALAGAVYVYQYNGDSWVQQQKLFGNDTDADDGFGQSVSINDNRLVIGAHLKENGALNQSGAVYVFELVNGNWLQVNKIIAVTPLMDARFGTSVSVFNDNLVVGSPGVNNDTGSAYVYTYDNISMQWAQGDVLQDINSVAGDKFGYSLSLYTSRVLVGVDTGLFNSIEGYATIFESLSNNQQIRITVTNTPALANSFGYSVSLYQDRALIGAFLDKGTNQNRSGSAYLFEFDNNSSIWNQVEKFTATGAIIGGTNNANFGNSVSLLKDRALIGNFHGRPVTNQNSGLAFLFEYDGSMWNRTLLKPSVLALVDQFGYSVALSPRWAMIGANLDDNTVQKPNAGSAYLLDVDALFLDSFE